MENAQREKDKALLTKIWYMLRDYSDIKNTEEDAARWKDLIDTADHVEREDIFARIMMHQILTEIECRSRGVNIRWKMPEDEKKLLRIYRNLPDKKKAVLLDMLTLID